MTRRDRAIRHIGQVLFPINPTVTRHDKDNGELAEWLYDHGIRPRRWHKRETWHDEDGKCPVCAVMRRTSSDGKR